MSQLSCVKLCYTMRLRVSVLKVQQAQIRVRHATTMKNALRLMGRFTRVSALVLSINWDKGIAIFLKEMKSG